MEQKTRLNLLGVYDLILALGAIFTGVLMISSTSGIFVQYPKEWLSKVPFESWFIPGIIAIVVFGIGNVIASIWIFKKANNKSWIASALMGGIFFILLVF